MSKVKIDVYLSSEHKKKIKDRAKKIGLSISDYMWLKALDMLREDDDEPR